MTTAAVLPVKSFARGKSRTGLPDADRGALAEAMALDVLDALVAVGRLDLLVVVTREPRMAGAARAAGALVVDDPHEPGHSAAASAGTRAATARGAGRVLLVPGDCPALDPAEVGALIAGDAPGVVVVPDRHGTGTNALLLAPPDAIAPAFGPGSCARHVALAREAGAPIRVERVPSLAHDVDTPEDLATLTGAGPRTQALAGALVPG